MAPHELYYVTTDTKSLDVMFSKVVLSFLERVRAFRES